MRMISGTSLDLSFFSGYFPLRDKPNERNERSELNGVNEVK